MSTISDLDLHVRLDGLEHLLRDLEQCGDPEVHAKTSEVVETVLAFHGAALSRIVEGLSQGGAECRELLKGLSRDPLVGQVLSLHGLHPEDLPTRIRQALDQVRPLLRSHGGNVELLSVDEQGVVSLRLVGSCQGCPSSQMTLKNSIETALLGAVPEVTAIRVEGLAEQRGPDPASVFVPLTLSKPHERCELCSSPVAAEHRHLFDRAGKKLICSCDACALLLCAEGGRFRQMAGRIWDLTGLPLGDAQWERLQIPIGLAFLRFDSAAGRVVATYPSPAGAMESTLPLEAWRDLVQGQPALESMQPDVEALLVQRVGQRREQYLVPIDECYRLIGLVRANWSGLSGGTAVWNRITEFFDELRTRAELPR